MTTQIKLDIQKNLKLKSLILVTIIIVFMLCINALWHANNELPQGKDTFSHLNKLNIAWKILRMEKHHYYYKYDQSYIHNLIFIVYDYPFFYYYASLFFYLLVFPLLGFKAVYISSAFFSCLMIIFTYKTARLLLGRNAGIFAAYLSAFAPFNITNSRNFNLEITVVATISITIYLFLRSHFFMNRKFSVLAALAASASMLTRATAAIPLLGIIIWFFAQAYSRQKKSDRRLKIQIQNFLLFLLIFLSITMIYYGNYNVMNNHIMRGFSAYKSPLLHSFSAYSCPADLFYRIQYYGKGLLKQGLGGNYIFAVLFVLALIRANKLLRKTAFFLILIPLCIIILIPKNVREELEWIMPVLPVVVTLLSSSLKLKNKLVRNSVAVFIPLFLILQCMTLSFQEQKALTPFLQKIFTGKILAAQKCPAYKDLFDDLSSREKPGGLKLGIIAENKGLQFIPIFSAAAELHRKNWELTELDRELQVDISAFDYVIIVSGNKNHTSIKNLPWVDSRNLVFLEKEYDFRSNYFRICEFVFLFKSKK